MAMLKMILRKMLNNKWLEFSLLLGLIFSVALVSSMPIYTNAILERMLVKDLENLQQRSGQYPGIYWAAAYFKDENEEQLATLYERLTRTGNYLREQIAPSFSVPIHYVVEERITVRAEFEPVDPTRVNADARRLADFVSLRGMEDHIRLVDGRMPNPEPVNGFYEVLVVPGALDQLNLVLGNEFQIKSDEDEEAPIKVIPVGVIEKKSQDDLFWYTSNINSYNTSFFIPFELFEREFTHEQKLGLRATYWYVPFDYTKLGLLEKDNMLSAWGRMAGHLNANYSEYDTHIPSLQTVLQYEDREQRLRTLLWSLNVPVIVLLAYYLFMVANLITERQKTEIAVLRSRGASRFQIVSAYFIESTILGIIALIVGPYLGMFFTKMLGASNGFLEFVQRAALNVKLDRMAFQYAFVVAAFSVLMTIIPVFLATRASIVGQKREMSRRTDKKSAWHRFFIDIILLGVSIYGLRQFHQRLEDLRAIGADNMDLRVDPLLFVIPALFMIGFGLFILRLYPLFIRFVYWIGRKWWPPFLYSSLIQVGRSSSQYQFLMVFLILTVATGLFSASAARTLNQNVEDRIMYSYGSDIVMETRWESNAPLFGMSSIDEEESEESAPAFSSTGMTQYAEPPFQPILELKGVEHAARVFIKENASFQTGNTRYDAVLMGIHTKEFGETAWYRSDMFGDYHFNDYLNLLASNPSAVLVSQTMAEQAGIRVGQTIEIGWTGVTPKPVIVYGIVEFFPKFNPFMKGSGNRNPMLIVGHLDFIQNNLALEPYEIWIKLEEGASLQELADDIVEKELLVTRFRSSLEDIIEARRDPFQMAMNGVMTLGFLISILICFCGFLLYWVISLFSRVLQLGIFRAMGISFPQIIGMLISEQLLTSGAAIFIGVITGHLASQYFVPLFQLSFNPTEQVPPFKVIYNANDYLQMYTIVTCMIVLGLIILGWLLSRIKIHQAVKLGED